MKQLPHLVTALTAALCLLTLASQASAGDLYALTNDSRLLTFDDSTPGTPTDVVAVTGLSELEELIALEVHPCDGRVLALSNQDRIYTIDPTTGAATVLSNLSGAIGDSIVGAALDLATLDLRVVDESDGNRTIDVETGVVTSDANLHYDPLGADAGRDPSASAIACVDGALLAIDTDLDELVAIDSPADGVLRRVGRLGVDATAPVGLDYRAGDDSLLASMNVGGLSGLYAIDPSTGHIRFLGTIGDGTPVVDLAAAALPAHPVDIEKLDLKFNFKKSGKDSIQVRGRIPVPAGALEGLVATVDVGGVERLFTLDKNGRGTAGDASFQLEGKPKDGLVKYEAKFKKGDFSEDLADEGMDGTQDAKDEERQVDVVIVLDGVTHASEATVRYTAKVGKDGKAKLSSTRDAGSVPGAKCPSEPAASTHRIEIRGNANTVTLAIGAQSSNPFVVTDNDQNLTVFVPAEAEVEVVITGNGNTLEVPQALVPNTTVTDTGNENSVRNLE